MRKAPFCRSDGNYDTDEVSLQTGTVCPEPTLTQQHQAEDADINVIMERYAGNGGLLPLSQKVPLQGDFTEAPDFATSQQLIARAHQAFMALPAKLRARFNNDPGELVDFMSDEANRDEAVRLGLAEAPEAAPEAAPAAAAAAASSPSPAPAGAPAKA